MSACQGTCVRDSVHALITRPAGSQGIMFACMHMCSQARMGVLYLMRQCPSLQTTQRRHLARWALPQNVLLGATGATAPRTAH